ncbi:synaptonemal complex protein 1-like [Scomber scombrus]|uniref:Synaptonemal complex protein 1-like n=1 Tax=Scomber scombrus TaxID=13677 RepID=A0AAV1NSC8_SCOSC
MTSEPSSQIGLEFWLLYLPESFCGSIQMDEIKNKRVVRPKVNYTKAPAIHSTKAVNCQPKSYHKPTVMDVRQKQSVVRPRYKGDQQNRAPYYGAENCTNFSGPRLPYNKRAFQNGVGQPNLRHENAALRAQIKEFQLQQQQSHRRQEAAENEIKYLRKELKVLNGKCASTFAGFKTTNTEVRVQLEELKQQNNCAAQTSATKSSQKDPEDSGNDNNAEELQQKLPKAGQDLEEQAAQNDELQEKLSTAENLRMQCEVKVLQVEKHLESLTFSNIEQLEELQRDNEKVIAALKKAEQEKASIEKDLQEQKEMWAQKEAALDTRLAKLESTMTAFLDKQSKKKKSWLVRLFCCSRKK